MVTVTIGVKGGVHTELFRKYEAPAAKYPQKAPPLIDRRRLNDPRVKSLLEFGVPLALLLSPLSAVKAFAAPAAIEAGDAIPVIGDAIKGKILHAFDPLIDLIVALSYPIAGLMIAGGCLFIMVGNRERGMSILQNAALGYILVQLSPLMLDLLVGIGKSI
ncbi:hypothetical protein [Paenibacillus sp.]|uniref:hypothetical protein n=1 Tax=Paenibacillus sp. TaxID=58172 RepID=UPI002D643087|nr:hypothetical protein [Paenibacillus sp.]HZG87288.1 hypothetical protein [Paenibacillus sp.]